MAENIMERLNRIGAERKIADFKVKQKQDYEFKKRYAYIRAWEFYNEAAKHALAADYYNHRDDAELIEVMNSLKVKIFKKGHKFVTLDIEKGVNE